MCVRQNISNKRDRSLFRCVTPPTSLRIRFPNKIFLVLYVRHDPMAKQRLSLSFKKLPGGVRSSKTKDLVPDSARSTQNMAASANPAFFRVTYANRGQKDLRQKKSWHTGRDVGVDRKIAMGREGETMFSCCAAFCFQQEAKRTLNKTGPPPSTWQGCNTSIKASRLALCLQKKKKHSSKRFMTKVVYQQKG